MFGEKGIVVVFAAFAVGAAAGWFAERAWGGAAGRGLPALPDGQCDDGRARSPSATNGRASRTPASASRTACGWGISATADAAAEKPNVSEAELAALRDKAALLDKELKVLLDARARKAKAEAQERDGDDSQKDKLEVSVEEAFEKCKTSGELKRRYPNVWKQQHGRFVEHATRVLKKYDSWRGYMSGLDVSSMTDEERENHTRMMEIYEKKHALMRENLEGSDNDEWPLEREKENINEMNRLDEEGRKLMAAERNTILRITAENMGRRLGWQEADTAEFAETLRAVGDATSGDMAN